MSFQSLGFLLFFAAAAGCGCLLGRRFASPSRAGVRVWFLALCSFLFYVLPGVGAHPLAPMAPLLGLVVTSFAVRRLRTIRRRRLVFALAVGWHIAVLLVFKYAGVLTGGRLVMPFVPLGISFFTFQQIWLLKELYDGAFVPDEAGGPGLFLYAFFFPSVTSGPILKPRDFFPQLPRRALLADREDLAAGLYALSRGYAKKLLLADPLGSVVANGWALGEDMTAPVAWVVILGYTLQLYLDFSGYCDIASGCARMLGIRLPVNFDSPYRALSVGEFWKRWHMTLTAFLRECVYFPLGGSRRGMGRACVNILVVYFISGFWHGSGWTFLAWGLLHGLAQVGERLLGERRERLPKGVRWLLTFLFVNLAWVFFQAPSLDGAWSVLRAAVLGGGGLPLEALAARALDTEATVLRTLLPRDLAWIVPPLVLLALLGGGLTVSLRRRGVVQRMEEFPLRWRGALVSGGLLVWAVLSFSSTGTFIYSNF